MRLREEIHKINIYKYCDKVLVYTYTPLRISSHGRWALRQNFFGGRFAPGKDSLPFLPQNKKHPWIESAKHKLCLLLHESDGGETFWRCSLLKCLCRQGIFSAIKGTLLLDIHSSFTLYIRLHILHYFYWCRGESYLLFLNRVWTSQNISIDTKFRWLNSCDTVPFREWAQQQYCKIICCQ